MRMGRPRKVKDRIVVAVERAAHARTATTAAVRNPTARILAAPAAPSVNPTGATPRVVVKEDDGALLVGECHRSRIRRVETHTKGRHRHAELARVLVVVVRTCAVHYRRGSLLNEVKIE